MQRTVKEKCLDAFDFLVVAFLNIGTFFNKNDGLTGEEQPEFYTLTDDFIREHHDASSSWQEVNLKKLQTEIDHSRTKPGLSKLR